MGLTLPHAKWQQDESENSQEVTPIPSRVGEDDDDALDFDGGGSTDQFQGADQNQDLGAALGAMSLSDISGLSDLSNLSNIGHMGNMGNMGHMGNMGYTGNMGHMGNMGNVGRPGLDASVNGMGANAVGSVPAERGAGVVHNARLSASQRIHVAEKINSLQLQARCSDELFFLEHENIVSINRDCDIYWQLGAVSAGQRLGSLAARRQLAQEGEIERMWLTEYKPSLDMLLIIAMMQGCYVPSQIVDQLKQQWSGLRAYFSLPEEAPNIVVIGDRQLKVLRKHLKALEMVVPSTLTPASSFPYSCYEITYTSRYESAFKHKALDPVIYWHQMDDWHDNFTIAVAQLKEQVEHSLNFVFSLMLCAKPHKTLSRLIIECTGSLSDCIRILHAYYLGNSIPVRHPQRPVVLPAGSDPFL